MAQSQPRVKERQDATTRKLSQRHVPFTSLALVPILALVAGLALHYATAGINVVWRIAPRQVGDKTLTGGTLLDWHTPSSEVALRLTCAAIMALACGLALAAHGLALARKAKPMVRHMLVGTILASGLLLLLPVALGLDWWVAFWFLFFGEGLALLWSLARIDSLRADRKEGDGDDDTWGKVFGIPRTKVGRPEVDEKGNVHATLTHGPGETTKDAQSALARIESAARSIDGRSRIVKDKTAGTSKMTIVFSDPLKTWASWPGLSHPGGLYAAGFRTAYYETGDAQWYWTAAGTTADGEPRSATHIARMGTTRSGKSGDSACECAETLSRRDALVIYADDVKGAQSAGWMLRYLTMYADTQAKAKAMFKGIQALVKYRANEMGRYGYRDWSTAVYEDPRLRFAAVHYYIDEADTLINTEVFKWLATKALSVGVFLSVALPRADHESMPTTARFSIGGWKCFGTGDEYSAAFALTQAVRDAGAAPENWKATIPGAHYLDTASGVSAELYPVACRTFKADHDELAADVEEARQLFVPATFTDKEIAVLGKVFAMCAPANALVFQPDAQQAPPEQQALPEGNEEPVTEEEEDEAVQDMKAKKPKMDDPKEQEALEKIDARQPIERGDAPDISFGDGKPGPRNAKEMADEFDRVVVELAREMNEITNQDVQSRMRTAVDAPWLSRRLTAVANGSIIAPPGITLERRGRGRYGVIYESVGNAA